MEGRYREFFNLHMRYGDDDTLINVAVEEIQQPLKPSTGVGRQSNKKPHEFKSEKAAYEFMDLWLKANAPSSARLPVSHQVPWPGGAFLTPPRGL